MGMIQDAEKHIDEERARLRKKQLEEQQQKQKKAEELAKSKERRGKSLLW